MSTPLNPFNTANQGTGATPLNTLATPRFTAASPAASSTVTAGTVTGPEGLTRSIRRCLDGQTDVSIVKLQAEMMELNQMIQNAFYDPSSNFDGQPAPIFLDRRAQD